MKTFIRNSKPKNNLHILLILLVLLSSFYFLLFTTQSFAANEDVFKAAEQAAKLKLSCANDSTAYPWCKTGETPGGFVATFYRIALGLVGGAALGVLIYGAILWTLSEAVTSKEEAKKWITGAVWGLALLLGAYLILYTINPDLVNISQTQSFLDKLIQRVNISKPTIEDLYRSTDDSKTRAFLADNGIIENKAACKSAEDTNCTSLANLPQSAVDGVIKIKKECGEYNTAFYKTPESSQCSVVITGGTEAGHKEHGSDKAVIDLRLKQSQVGESGFNTNLYSYIHDKIGLKSGLLGVGAEPIEYNKRYTATDGSFTVIREKNEKDGTEHFHIAFK